MNTSQINAYKASMKTGSAAASGNQSQLRTSDFLTLLAKQMSCQDPLNPTDNTQYLSELAQFSSLQISENQYNTATAQLDMMNTMTSLQYMQFGSVLVGKTVEVETTDADGKKQSVKGIVNGVDYTTDIFMLSIDGKNYPISMVKRVLTTA